MKAPSEKIIKRLFALSGNVCAFPQCSSPIVEAVGTITGEICHIRAQNEGGPRFDNSQTEEERHDFENLILLCRRHHKIVDTEPHIYSADALEEIKRIQETEKGRPELATDTFYAKILLGALNGIEINNNSGNILIDSPGAIQATTVNVRARGRTLKFEPAAGTIGADGDASRYVQHLITRYNEFASADKSRPTKFSYGAVSKNIEKKFRAPWKMLDKELFEEVCAYLQQRISKTRVAKLNMAKGIKAFSCFEDFLQIGRR